MTYLFKQAALFRCGPKSSDIKKFSKGIHDVSPAVEACEYFKLMLKSGLIISTSEKAPVSPLVPPSSALVEQQKKAVEKLKAENAAKAAGSLEPVEAKDEEEKSQKYGKKK